MAKQGHTQKRERPIGRSSKNWCLPGFVSRTDSMASGRSRGSPSCPSRNDPWAAGFLALVAECGCLCVLGYWFLGWPVTVVGFPEPASQQIADVDEAVEGAFWAVDVGWEDSNMVCCANERGVLVDVGEGSEVFRQVDASLCING